MNPKRFKNRRFLCSFGAISACLIATFSLNSSVLAQDTWYVDADVEECDNLGDSWPNALKYLQDALDEAISGDEIWVAAGTYYADQDCSNPDGTGFRTATFQLVKEVFLLGGFNGTELLASDRDSVANITILSGALRQGQDPPDCAANGLSCFDYIHSEGCLFEIDPECCTKVCDEDPICCIVAWDQTCAEIALDICGGSYHVVTAGSEIDDPGMTVIDGFLIRDGTARNAPDDEDFGGGMFIEGDVSVVRCTFTSNAASNRGAGMSINGAAPDIINCVFEDNPGDQVLITDNGGGLASDDGDARLVNCLFVDNVADFDGGAIHNSVGIGVNGTITLINCTVYGNTANSVGEAYKGGGLYNAGTGSIIDIDNSIFWDNEPDEIEGNYFVGSQVDFTDVEGGSPVGGMGNLAVNPIFVFAPVNLRLQETSPVIDMGNTDELVIPCDFFNLDNDDLDCTFMADERTPDLDLINRILDGDNNGADRVDMGAYEFIHPFECIWDLNGDGMVGLPDLAILLGEWGPCVDCGNCPADFDGSCVVGASDMLDLLANWGACPAYSVEPPSLADELALHCLNMVDWNAFVAMMTDPNSSQADKDNYLCWMLHYLEDCNKCFCTGQANCPDDDPFNG